MEDFNRLRDAELSRGVTRQESWQGDFSNRGVDSIDPDEVAGAGIGSPSNFDHRGPGRASGRIHPGPAGMGVSSGA